MQGATGTVRIGYVGGQSRRLYERVIHDWAKTLSQQVELVKIPPFAFMKLFGGSILHWVQCLPESLPFLSEGLERLGQQYGLDAWYVNMPMIAPYLLMARNYGQFDLGFLLLAHSVGSEAWLRQWVAVAPWLTERDVLMVGSRSVKQALCQISPQFAVAIEIPPCIAIPAVQAVSPASPPHVLAVGVNEGKNIEVLLDCFAEVRTYHPDVRLTLFGEIGVRVLAAAEAIASARGGGVAGTASWTASWARTVASSFTKAFGTSNMSQTLEALEAQEVERMRVLVMRLVEERGLTDAVTFAVPATEEERAAHFANAYVLVDLSTDPGETLGLHLLQAKACGLPVVCTSWNGFSERMESGVDGVLIDIDWSGERPQIDRAGVVQALVGLLSDGDWHAQLVQGAFQRAPLYENELILPRVVQALEAARTQEVEWSRLMRWAEGIAVEDDEWSGPLNPVEHSLFSRVNMEERRCVAHAVHLLAFTPLRQLGHLYHLPNLEALHWLEDTPTSVLTGGSHVSHQEWYAKVRPILSHYAEGKPIHVASDSTS